MLQLLQVIESDETLSTCTHYREHIPMTKETQLWFILHRVKQTAAQKVLVLYKFHMILLFFLLIFFRSWYFFSIIHQIKLRIRKFTFIVRTSFQFYRTLFHDCWELFACNLCKMRERTISHKVNLSKKVDYRKSESKMPGGTCGVLHSTDENRYREMDFFPLRVNGVSNFF